VADQARCRNLVRQDFRPDPPDADIVPRVAAVDVACLRRADYCFPQDGHRLPGETRGKACLPRLANRMKGVAAGLLDVLADVVGQPDSGGTGPLTVAKDMQPGEVHLLDKRLTDGELLISF